ncbi:MAG: hypothetical protein JSW58_03925 [Candidatus Latescibacterota bacterium]|nr:MAG: hypothetical protein JSW58_03925 [Candidatus Latescibacterota bacterium]
MRVMAVLVISLTCITGVVDAAEKPLMFRFKSVGVEEDLVDATMMLFKGSLEEEGKYRPVSADDVMGYVECYESTCAAEIGWEAGYEKAIIGSLTRLGYKIIVRVQLVDTRDGTVLYSEDGVSESEEDLDTVLARLAKGVTTGSKFEGTAEVGMITEKEALEDRRRESYSSKGLRVGFIWPIDNSFGNKIDRLTALDFAYQHDLPDFFLAGRSGIRWGDGGVDICFLDAKIGRYLSRGDFTPFVNGGVGVHYIRGKETVQSDDVTASYSWDDGAYGLVLLGGAGFTAFRTYDFQFQIDVDYFIMLDKINDEKVEGSDARRPQGILFTFCIRKN